MAQKNKVKELVGRGLNSYHTKALQQMDRIEKKNKEQNHKISILSNELDNDYLTKTEEGSVISLEHSKEGMVYLDELQGNTLVNYCTDGSKELTLNGDIDVEGVSVTTTEGVDNGKVDVYCEGNTLVNLVNRYNYNANQYHHVCFFKSGMLKPSTKYSAIITNLSNENMKLYWNEGIFNYVEITIPANSTKVFTHTTKAEMNIDEQSTLFKNAITHTQAIQFKVILLEGDWANRELPSYFEGMKSVGQDDENGYKIEILSQSKNLLKPTREKYPYFIKKGEKLTLSTKNGVPSEGGNVLLYDINNKVQWFAIDAGQSTRTLTTNSDIYYMQNQLGGNGNIEFQVEKGTVATSYVPYSVNKKEILINEPLRKVNDNLKDRFVKIGNKWFIEKNCKVQTLNGSEGWRISDGGTQFICNQHRTDALGSTNIPIICDKINVTTHKILDDGEGYGINLSYYLRINLRDCDAKNGATVEQFIQRLQANPVTIIYPLKTPTYEPLETEPTLNTYNDVTHISNNSLIPCNMKVKNTGYNAIIKPSTLYTVALDTNKAGTIGMNLGGAKGTTTNNVLTLTTPATLTDDSLRLYGKGIKGSKVRLLEGDKTNWIPSYFEGMKSCFEDKVQDDGSYKMEILSNNKNLINAPNMSCTSSSNGGWWNLEGNNNSMYNNIDKKTNLYFYAEKGKRYIISFDSKNLALTQRLKYQQQEMMLPLSTISNENGRYKLLVIGDGLYSTFRFRAKIEDGSTPMEITNFMIIEENLYSNEFIKNKSNKIQFSSIEPLRSVNLRNRYAKDRFVFKDDKLVIERNCKKIVLDGTQFFSKNADQSKDGTSLFGTGDLTPERPSYHVECDSFGSSGNNLMTNTTFANIEGIGCWSAKKNFNIRIKTCRLKEDSGNGMMEYVRENPITIIYPTSEPTYEEIPFELQKIILEGYENGTLFIDTNIPPTVTTTYAGETPIVKATKLNKTEVLNNTEDINDNIIPYLMDMDYRVVMLQLATEELEGGVSMARLFGGTYEMIKRDILSKRLTREEYGHRLADYFNAGKLTEEQVRELEELR